MLSNTTKFVKYLKVLSNISVFDRNYLMKKWSFMLRKFLRTVTWEKSESRCAFKWMDHNYSPFLPAVMCIRPAKFLWRKLGQTPMGTLGQNAIAIPFWASSWHILPRVQSSEMCHFKANWTIMANSSVVFSKVDETTFFDPPFLLA